MWAKPAAYPPTAPIPRSTIKIRRLIVVLRASARSHPAPGTTPASAPSTTAAPPLLDEVRDLRALLLGEGLVDLAHGFDGGSPRFADDRVVRHEDVAHRRLVDRVAAEDAREVSAGGSKIAFCLAEGGFQLVGGLHHHLLL